MSENRVFATEQVLASLDYRIDLSLEDVEACLRQIWTLPLSAQDRTVTLLNSPKLLSWLSSMHSSALFVNGNHDASARQSPLTYVCAKLMDTIAPWTAGKHANHRSIFAQVFFCGQHADLDDPERGPLGMMRSLVSQLLTSFSAFRMTTIRSIRDIDASDVYKLCDAYASLIKEVPRRYMIFCIIDGITFYEDSPWQCEAATVAIQKLLEVMDTCKKRGCFFKILLTCPGMSRELYREFEDEEILWMPQNVDSHGGLTSAKWRASIEPKLNEWLEDTSI